MAQSPNIGAPPNEATATASLIDDAANETAETESMTEARANDTVQPKRTRRRPQFVVNERHYWIGVVSRNHVEAAIAGGFAQLNHGKAGALERMRRGDGFIYYSPRESYPDGEPLQAFTGIGRVCSETMYQATVEIAAGSRPFRIDVEYLPARCVPIKPMIDALSFIRSKTHWGAAFRFGVVRIPEPDFVQIAAAMGRSFFADFGSSACNDVMK
jgi:hypothetical protein